MHLTVKLRSCLDGYYDLGNLVVLILNLRIIDGSCRMFRTTTHKADIKELTKVVPLVIFLFRILIFFVHIQKFAFPLIIPSIFSGGCTSWQRFRSSSKNINSWTGHRRVGHVGDVLSGLVWQGDPRVARQKMSAAFRNSG